MRMLMIEDDPVFGSALLRHLVRDGYAVDWIRRDQRLDAVLASNEYACLILDLNDSDPKDSEFLRIARSHAPRMPSLVITARDGKPDRLAILDLGADDYLVKPIDLDEASARIRAVTRRFDRLVDRDTEIIHGPLQLDAARRIAKWHDKAVPLTNKEFLLLETLVRNKRQVRTRAQLEQALYGWGEEVESNAIEVYIHFLRRKFSRELILTLRGIGYQIGLVETESAVAES